MAVPLRCGIAGWDVPAGRAAAMAPNVNDYDNHLLSLRQGGDFLHQ
jgi:hypothetical protein